MKTIQLAGQDVSRIAMGCMRMGDLSVEEAAAAIQAARDVGINFFDHADIYAGGESEVRFAEAVRKLGIKREDIVIQSKCGIDHGQYNFAKDYLLDCVDGILSRLDTDYLDVLLLHRPDTLFEPDEVNEAFSQLKEAGKVWAFGVSNMNPMQIELLQTGLDMPLVVNQLQFSLMHATLVDEGFNVNLTRDAGTMRTGGALEYARLKDMTIQAWSPLQYGFIEGHFVDNPDYPEVNEALEKLAKDRGVTKVAIALAWILRHPAKIQVLLGSMNPQRITQAADALKVELTHREWYDLYLAAGHELP